VGKIAQINGKHPFFWKTKSNKERVFSAAIFLVGNSK
jgi:hypothetical protein